MQDDSVHHLHKEGFDNLRVGFNEFLTENNLTYSDTGYFKIYSSVAVESTDIIRTAGNFYGNEWFSDIVVTSEDAEWYGKVYILNLLSITKFSKFSRYITLFIKFLVTFIIGIFSEKDKEPINLILLQWYDEIYKEKYGCPRLWLTHQYTCVYLDSINMSVHIVPRSNCKMNI